MTFNEMVTETQKNVVACERIQGRPVTNSEYIYIQRLVASIARAKESK